VSTERGGAARAAEVRSARLTKKRIMPHDDHVIASFLRRSYHAVDGLWFVTAEQDSDFEHALDLDVRVWRVLAKIQARKARELLGVSANTAKDLARCFSLKLDADGHRYSVEVAEGTVRFCVAACPWRELLQRSDRQHLAAQVAQTICPTEGAVWCAEFGGEWQFDMPQMACSGAESCEMRFSRVEAGQDRPG